MAACASCSAPVTSKNARARYCSDTCRARASKARKAAGGQGPAPAYPTPLTDTTSAELEAAGRAGTMLGQAALALARRIDSGAPTMASDVKQLQVTMAAALQGVKTGPVSALDELRARRDAKRGVG